MRKVLVIGLLLTAVIYLLPVFCGFLEDDAPLPIPQESVAADAEIGESAQPEEAEQTPAGTLAAAQEITVLVDGEVREMDLEEYVVSVVAGEISPDFPQEAIRAQAVAARTYAVCCAPPRTLSGSMAAPSAYSSRCRWLSWPASA